MDGCLQFETAGYTQRTFDEATWRRAGAELIAKILTEFSYENMIAPKCRALGLRGEFELELGDGVAYRFLGDLRIFGQVRVYHDYLQRRSGTDDWSDAYDPTQLIVDLRVELGIDGQNLARVAQEIGRTWFAEADRSSRPGTPSRQLISEDLETIESELTGHPWFIVSKGRVGFGFQDHQLYAPEARRAFQLVWVAVHQSIVDVSVAASISYPSLIEAELSHGERRRFEDCLRAHAQEPADYRLLPVHPWQWDREILLNYADDLASGKIIPLGRGDDLYRPQASIRTLANISRRNRRTIKLPLSILNTAVYRGLPPERARIAPQLTDWLQHQLMADEVLQQRYPLVLLFEELTMSVEHPIHSKIEGAPYQLREQLGVLWRSPLEIANEEDVCPLAALLHESADQRALVLELCQRSGLDLPDWLSQLFDVVFKPVVYCMMTYGVAFSPHGQNALLVHRNGHPVRLVLKDFVDDLNLVDEDWEQLRSIPGEIRSRLYAHPPCDLAHFFLTGLCVVHLRYLSDLLARHSEISESEFWARATRSLQNFLEDHPELAERAGKIDLLRRKIPKISLNRSRLVSVGYQDRAQRPDPDILEALDSPLHPDTQHRWAERERADISRIRVGLAAGHSFVDPKSERTLQFRAVDPVADLPLLHAWMNAPHVARRWNLAKSKSELERHFGKNSRDEHLWPQIVEVDGRAIAYVELYHGARDRLASYRKLRHDDYGIHLLIGPDSETGQRLGQAIVAGAFDYIFCVTGTRRCIGEPDHMATDAVRSGTAVGCKLIELTTLPEKTAAYLECPRREFERYVEISGPSFATHASWTEFQGESSATHV